MKSVAIILNGNLWEDCLVASIKELKGSPASLDALLSAEKLHTDNLDVIREAIAAIKNEQPEG